MSTGVTIDLRIAELICSHLCHDLISPVGAINNGIELLEDGDMSIADEAIALIEASGKKADALLRCFRLGYGSAGGKAGVGLPDARDVVSRYFAVVKSTLDWQLDATGTGLDLPIGTAKVLVNMMILAESALPVGGTVTATASAPGQARQIVVSAAGRNAALGEEAMAALKGATAIEDLTAQTIHAHMVGQFSNHYKLPVDVSEDAGNQVTLILHLPD